MNFPHGKTIADTLEYRMANPDGSWMGQGIGNVKENKLWYKEQVQFFEEGNYTVTIGQAMRNNGDVEGVTKLEGITDVGFSIEEATKQ
jgi:gliding motility-associated lipoprotein GldH